MINLSVSIPSLAGGVDSAIAATGVNPGNFLALLNSVTISSDANSNAPSNNSSPPARNEEADQSAAPSAAMPINKPSPAPQDETPENNSATSSASGKEAATAPQNRAEAGNYPLPPAPQPYTLAKISGNAPSGQSAAPAQHSAPGKKSPADPISPAANNPIPVLLPVSPTPLVSAFPSQTPGANAATLVLGGNISGGKPLAAAPGEKQLRHSLQDQLGNISQILQAVIQALSVAPPAPGVAVPSLTANAVVPSSPNSSPTLSAAPAALTSAASLPGVNLPMQWEQVLASSAAAPALSAASVIPSPAAVAVSPGDAAIPAQAEINAASSLTNAPAPTNAAEITLLQNIEGLVQQMQQALQSPAAPASSPAQPLAAPVSALPAASADSSSTSHDVENTLQALTGLLQQNMGLLAQFFAPQTASQAAATPALNMPQPTVPSAAIPALANLGGLGALLKDSIGQVRDQLQKLKGENEAVYAQAKNTASVPGDAEQAFKNALAASGTQSVATSDAKNSTSTASDAAPRMVSAATPAAVAAAPNITVSPVNMGSNPPAVAAAMDVSQGGADNSGTDDNGGNGQNQPGAQPLAAAGPSQPQSGNVSGSAFARALGHAAPAPLLDQVSFQVKTALADGSSKIHIQLDPADLGKLDIKLSVGADGKTGVVITADNKNTLSLLQQDTQGLTRALNDAGLTADGGSLSFNLRGGQQQPGQGGSAHALLTYQKTQPDDEEENLSASTITRSYTVNLAEGLDIRI